jgi:arginyl-tRNA synthetase
LTDRFSAAITAAFGDEHAQIDPLIRPSANPKFGDYQANVAMSLAKQLEQKPRDVAQAIANNLQIADLVEKTDIAGPGFINLTIKPDTLSEQLRSMASDEHLGIAQAGYPQTVVVDYSSPNVAKQMHVGHLRSTVIGDAIARVLAVQGHSVIRQNHLGDWGTQFGMLIERLVLDQSEAEAAKTVHTFADLEAFYIEAKQQFDSDPTFARRSRERVVKLQSGDDITLKLWDQFVKASAVRFGSIYERLDVLLTRDDIRGESFYNDRLAAVVADLEQSGALCISDGAKVVFPEGFKDRDGRPLPLIVQKSDGGYLYATTDLAAARYRIGELGADRIIYVTDARQSQHFAMVYATLRRVGWAPDNVQLEHVAFGTILGKDNRPFKTRDGGTVKLIDLLDEAEQRAAAVIEQKNPDLPADQRTAIAHAVGIGALKYADLSSDRIKDYVFDWDRMLALEGNTAPYLQNAYVRIRSIFRKGQIESASIDAGTIAIAEPSERALAIRLLQFPGVIAAVADSLEPHRLCTYLYELAAIFHQFYENCPVLKAADPATRDSRLAICDLVARTLNCGLDLLGIEVVEQM